MERHWRGIPRPWDQYIGKTYGKYITCRFQQAKLVSIYR